MIVDDLKSKFLKLDLTFENWHCRVYYILDQS